MNNIEILRSGFSDSLDILKTEEMDFICGGDTVKRITLYQIMALQSVVVVDIFLLLTIFKEEIQITKVQQLIHKSKMYL